MREAVFNALFSLGVVQDATVVDLFAGSGALGIEALSRGAATARFVDEDRRACTVIEENLTTLGFCDRAVVSCRSVDNAWSELGADVDLVLADPPYAFDDWDQLLARLVGHVADGAVVVMESDRSLTIAAPWEKVRERAYGGTVVTFVAIAAPTEPTDATGVHA